MRLFSGALLLAALPVAGQGGIRFDNRVPGRVVAPVFGAELSDATLSFHGNPTNGYPSGSQVYSGALLAGTNYTAELWGGPEGAQDCQLASLARTFFQTGNNAGYVQPPAFPVIVPGVSAGARAALQLRVWDNRGGAVVSWSQSECAPAARGASGLFLTDPLPQTGGSVYLLGLQSVNIFNAMLQGRLE